MTKEINLALSNMEHTVHSQLRNRLMQAVAPTFDGNGDAYFPLRPSGCLKSMRDLFYDLKNFYEPGSIPKSDFEPRVKLIFQFGHLTETLLKKLCQHNYKVEFEQQRVQYGELTDKDGSKIPLTGAIDWAMKLDPTSERIFLCDAKSIGDYPFKSAPKDENIAQMQLYMHSDWGRANKVDSAVLIYFNKNTSEIKCIQVEYDGGLATKILNRLYKVWDYFLKNEVPPREYLPGLDWKADYSPYRDYDNQEFAIAPENRGQIDERGEYAPRAFDKEAVRSHVEKYGNKIVNYLDKSLYILYHNEKLILREEAT